MTEEVGKKDEGKEEDESGDAESHGRAYDSA